MRTILTAGVLGLLAFAGVARADIPPGRVKPGNTGITGGMKGINNKVPAAKATTKSLDWARYGRMVDGKTFQATQKDYAKTRGESNIQGVTRPVSTSSSKLFSGRAVNGGQPVQSTNRDYAKTRGESNIQGVQAK